jgi:UDP-glucose 4-epimerase
VTSSYWRSRRQCVADILVIGANGFLGSHVVDRLVADGHAVTAFDRFSSSTPTFTSTPARIVVGDFLSRSDLEEAVRGQQFVLHLLSTTSPATAESDPGLDIRTNVAQSVELLEACVGADIERFFFASTGGAIYGSQGKAEYSELDRVLPVSPYAIGKLAIENYLRYFRVTHGLASTTFRVSNPYGTRQRPNHKQGFIPIALRSIALGEPVIRLGNGSMVRDYLYVEDFATMLCATIGADFEHEVYNLGSGLGYSVNDVLASLERATGPFEIEERPVPPTFVDRVVLDMARFTLEFGTPQLTSLDDGIRCTNDEIRSQIRG